MTEIQKVQLRQSELREKLNAAAAVESPTEEQLEGLRKLSTEYNGLEVRYRALLQGSAEDKPDKGGDKPDKGGADKGDAEERELDKLRGKVELRSYLVSAMDGTALSGPEKELNQALKVATDGGAVQVPWDVLILPEERAAMGRRVEERVDVVTSPDAAQQTENMQPILARIFKQTIAAWLGVSMPMAAVGQRSYPVMTGGTTAALKAKDAEQDAAAATYTVTSVEPTRLTARYLFRVEDLATVQGLEGSLRGDLRDVMGDALDDAIITGDGTSPNFAGLFDSGSGIVDPADPSAEATVDDYIDVVTGQVDGINAYQTGDVRLLIGTNTLQHAAKKFITGTDTSALTYLMRMSGGYRVSARVPAFASKQQEGMAIRRNGVAVAPMWPTLSLIRDVYSGASKGQVALTAIALYGFKVVRINGWTRFKLQLEA